MADLFDQAEPAPIQPTKQKPALWTRAGESGRPIVWSYGGGTQSAAVAVAVLRGLLPRPERIVMADTSREATATWDYLHNVVGPALDREGLTVEIAPHSLAAKDVYSTSGKPLMPMYSRATGGVGMMQNYCSGEWKRDVVRRYLRSVGYGPKNPIENWLGMSTDELGRLTCDDRQWIRTAWPLVMALRWNRADCRREVLAFGWPPPPKSSCWMCPYRSNAQWRLLRDEYPADWQAAIALEAEIRAVDPALYFHSSGVPLAEADLDGGRAQAELPCTSGYCYV